MKLKIKSRKVKPFQSSDGETIDYFWYDAIKVGADELINFGSREGGHEIGQTLDLEVVKYQRQNGEYGYKELVEN